MDIRISGALEPETHLRRGQLVIGDQRLPEGCSSSASDGAERQSHDARDVTVKEPLGYTIYINYIIWVSVYGSYTVGTELTEHLVTDSEPAHRHRVLTKCALNLSRAICDRDFLAEYGGTTSIACRRGWSRLESR